MEWDGTEWVAWAEIQNADARAQQLIESALSLLYLYDDVFLWYVSVSVSVFVSVTVVCVVVFVFSWSFQLEFAPFRHFITSYLLIFIIYHYVQYY